MKSREFHERLERGEFLPLYYFYGPEKGLLNDALRRLEDRLLEPATRAFNREVVDAEEEGPEEILDKARTLPVGMSRRLVVIRRADGIWKQAAEIWISYFEDPAPSTCTVFVGEKADFRTRFFQTLEKTGAAVSFYPPSPREILTRLRERAQQTGHPLSAEGASLLLELIGPNLQDLEGEVQKIAAGLKEAQGIEVAHIAELTENTRLESPFDLPKAIGRSDLRGALGIFRKTWQQGSSSPLFFSLILRHLRALGKAREWKKEGISAKEIEGRLHVTPWESNAFWEQVRNVSSRFGEEAWRKSLEADRASKSSRADRFLIMEEYLWSLFRLKNQ